VIIHDRRLGQRVAFEAPGRLQWDGHDVACRTEDISMHGARLRLPGDLADVPPPCPGATVQVTLLLDGILTVFRARVGWQRPEEAGPALGVQFLAVQRRQEELLQPIVLRGTPV
jgi:hypothetical protein